jgi:hypothetical protein
MRKADLVDETEVKFRGVGDPSLREEDRSGRDDASALFRFCFADVGRGFMTGALGFFYDGVGTLLTLI